MKNLRQFVRLRTAAAFNEWKKRDPRFFPDVGGHFCAAYLERLLDELDTIGVLPIICDKCNGRGNIYIEEELPFGFSEWTSIECNKCNGQGYVMPNEISEESN